MDLFKLITILAFLSGQHDYKLDIDEKLLASP